MVAFLSNTPDNPPRRHVQKKQENKNEVHSYSSHDRHGSSQALSASRILRASGPLWVRVMPLNSHVIVRREAVYIA